MIYKSLYFKAQKRYAHKDECLSSVKYDLCKMLEEIPDLHIKMKLYEIISKMNNYNVKDYKTHPSDITNQCITEIRNHLYDLYVSTCYYFDNGNLSNKKVKSKFEEFYCRLVDLIMCPPEDPIWVLFDGEIIVKNKKKNVFSRLLNKIKSIL